MQPDHRWAGVWALMAKVYAPVLPGDDEDAAARADDLLVKVLLVKVLLEPTTCSAML